jgi:hypothetical protein
MVVNGMYPLVGQSLYGASFHLSFEICLCNSFHGYIVPHSKKELSIHTLVLVILEFQEAGVGGLGSRAGEGRV